MSKKIDEIYDDYKAKSEAARRIMNEAVKLNITYFEGVTEVAQGHYNEQGKWQTDNPKYRYNGCGIKNTYSEANADRNADIDSKIGILKSRISSCKSKKGELDAVNNECNISLKNLSNDISILQKVQSSVQSISQSVTSITNQYGNLSNGVYNTYKCNLKNLDQGNSIEINTVKSRFSSSSISDGISKLEKYIQKGEIIKTGIESLIKSLEERISELEAQKNMFEGMKE